MSFLSEMARTCGRSPLRSLSVSVLASLWVSTAWAGISCSVSAPGLNFGVYNYLSSPSLAISTSLSVSCTCSGSNTLSYSISLSKGAASSYAPRQMQSGTNRLDYNLYMDAAHIVVWGDGTGGSQVASASGINCKNTTYTATPTVYGLIPPSPNVVPGNYQDSTITVTMTY